MYIVYTVLIVLIRFLKCQTILVKFCEKKVARIFLFIINHIKRYSSYDKMNSVSQSLPNFPY